MDTNKKVAELDVNDVLPNRFQPRIKFNEDSINELSESIKEHGVIEPIIVRPMGDKYEIIAGERRYKASLLAGKQSIPAIVVDLNDKDSAEIALIENVQRKDLTPIEEAISYKKILDMGYLTQDELATKLGKNQSTVANKLRLLNLADEVQEAVLEERISERHARSLLKIHDQSKQVELLNRIINERLTVRKTDEEIAKILGTAKPEPIVIKEEKKGDVRMNDNFDPFATQNSGINPIGFDMPAPMPGIEPLPPVEASPAPAAPTNQFINIPVPDVNPVMVDNSQNPGFMDVANIQNNAQAINVEKPVADLTSLLTPATPVAVPAAEPVAPANQFVNLTQAPAAPAVEPQKVEALNSNPELFSFDFEPIPSPTVVPAPVEAPAVATPVATPEVQPAAPVVEQSPSVEPAPAPVLPAFDFMNPNFDTIPSVPAIEPVTQAAEVAAPVAVTPAVEVPQEVLPDKIEVTPVPVNTAIPSEEMPIPTLDAAPAQVKPNVNEAISIIRDCIKQLEDRGFVINNEEIDFETLYQLTIKIQK